jgi:hypothetical protein
MIGVGEFAGIRLLQFSPGKFTGEGLIAFFAVQAVMVGCCFALGSGAETILARLERLERSGNDPAAGGGRSASNPSDDRAQS